MTGGDTMTARFLRQEYFEFEPQFTPWLATNHKPEIRGQDEAIWRRIRLIPFEQYIPPAERDPDLKAKLAAELPGILNWALDGCAAWQADGLAEPPAVIAATNAYREDQDDLGKFIADRCRLDPAREERTADLYAAYAEWPNQPAVSSPSPPPHSAAASPTAASNKPAPAANATGPESCSRTTSKSSKPARFRLDAFGRNLDAFNPEHGNITVQPRLNPVKQGRTKVKPASRILAKKAENSLDAFAIYLFPHTRMRAYRNRKNARNASTRQDEPKPRYASQAVAAAAQSREENAGAHPQEQDGRSVEAAFRSLATAPTLARSRPKGLAAKIRELVPPEKLALEFYLAVAERDGKQLRRLGIKVSRGLSGRTA